MMRAYLTISEEVTSDSFTRERIIEFIKTSGICSGILDDDIDEMVQGQIFNKDILIASGEEPVAGKDGRIAYEFNPHPTITPEIREDGSVDYMNVNIMQKVVPGQILARSIPAGFGKAGFDIMGNLLPAVSGRPISLGRGKNTSYADGGEGAIKSDVHGHVRLGSDGLVEVVTVYEVKGDLNYTTGSIDFNGDVIVNGDVLSRFKITATGEVEVKGVVEDAQIEAGRSVLVRGGFIGSGKGSIKAEEDVVIRYIHHQEVYAGRDIIIANESMNAHLIAGRNIKINGGAGVLVGGTTTAGLCIESKSLGNDKQTRTEIVIPFESELEGKIESQKKLIAGSESQLNKVERTLKKMEDADQSISLVDEARQKIYGSLYSTQHELKNNLEILNADLKELTDKVGAMKAALYVRASRYTFPGVTITIAGLQLQVQERLERQHFMISQGELVGVEMKHE